ncbi:hypothetical protein BGX38DRAFT_1152839, partial [Terfezia claveryi]
MCMCRPMDPSPRCLRPIHPSTPAPQRPSPGSPFLHPISACPAIEMFVVALGIAGGKIAKEKGDATLLPRGNVFQVAWLC